MGLQNSSQGNQVYGNTVIFTGRVQFHIKSFLAEEVFFTQSWTLRENKWFFMGCPGTMTGYPKNYPIYLAMIDL
jgi:hypothetical protein